MRRKLIKRVQESTALALAISLCLESSIAFSAHPLITEDTGTQGKGRWQLELTHDHAVNRDETEDEKGDRISVIITYGANDQLDLIVNLPYERRYLQDSTSSRHDRGIGDIEFAAKWRFLESEKTSLALRPGITLPTGNEEKNSGRDASLRAYSPY
jgi:hypothetical protein